MSGRHRVAAGRVGRVGRRLGLAVLVTLTLVPAGWASAAATGGARPADRCDVNITPDSFTVDTGTTTRLAISINDTTTGDGISFTVHDIGTAPAHGTAVIVAASSAFPGAVDYTPDPGYSGPDSFTYRDHEGNGCLTDYTTVTLLVSKPNTITAQDDAYHVAELEPLQIPAPGVLANDVSSDGSALTVTGVVPGDVEQCRYFEFRPDGGLSFNATPPLFGGTGGSQAGCEYQVTDGRGHTAQAHVAVTIDPPAPPVLTDDRYLAHTGVTLTVPAPGVLGNDTSNEPPLTATLVTGTGHGTLGLNGDGSFTYRSRPGFVGTDHFTYTASDQLHESAAMPATVTVQVEPQATVTAVSDQVTTVTTRPVAVNVLANDTDSLGGKLIVTAVTDPAHGTVTLRSPGTITYRAAPGFVGTDAFCYLVFDKNNQQAAAFVTVQVLPAVRRPPGHGRGGQSGGHRHSGGPHRTGGGSDPANSGSSTGAAPADTGAALPGPLGLAAVLLGAGGVLSVAGRRRRRPGRGRG